MGIVQVPHKACHLINYVQQQDSHEDVFEGGVRGGGVEPQSDNSVQERNHVSKGHSTHDVLRMSVSVLVLQKLPGLTCHPSRKHNSCKKKFNHE